LITTFIIFEGYEKTLKNTILGVNSHIYFFRPGISNLNEENLITIKDFLATKPEVNVYSAIISGQAIASYNNRSQGCIFKSINWASKTPSSIYQEAVFEGNYELNSANDVVIGKYLAQMLNVSIGDEIQLMSVSSVAMGASGIRYRNRKLTIVGLFYSGMYEYDSKFVFMNIETAQYLINTSEFNMVEVQLKSGYIEQASEIADRWSNDFAHEFQISSWLDFNGNLFSLLTLEKWVLTFIISFLIVVAGFNVITTTMASIVEKRKEIGILKAIGLSGRKIAFIYLTQNWLISILCIIIGIFLGIGIGFLISYQTMITLRGEVYLLDKIHIYIDFGKMFLLFFIALVIITIASLVPIIQISRMKEIEILRFRK